MITVKRLSTGYVMLKGSGPCEWAQVPEWPCSKAVLREHTFAEASISFRRECEEMLEAGQERATVEAEGAL